jgi:D-alanyl-D-alanine carboxypeptidase/D-alanyl-D-alanine-endopeptidase (penicillin-binding protein 4)
LKFSKPTRLVMVSIATVLTVACTSAALASIRSGPDTARAGADDAALTSALDKVLANSSLNGSMTSVQVLDAATGDVVYSKNADQRVVPASNEKLMTSAAALEYLGSAFRFHTVASYSGTKSGKTVSGNLYLKGGGDPTLTDGRIDLIASKIAAAGITKFTGGLIADDSAFDHTGLGSSWSWDDESYAYAAPISALTAASTDVFDTGSVAVATKPAATKGKAGVLSVLPRNTYVKITNNTVTGAAGTANTVTAVRTHGTNTIVVSGSVPLGGATTTDLASVQDPTLLAASAFRAALTRHKVTVVGATSVKATTGTVKKIYDLQSVKLSALLVPFLKLSNNGHAEILAKTMGHQATGKAGSWTNGLAQERTTLAGLGVNTSAVILSDGSGLSRRDLLTTRQVAALLETAQSKPWFNAWYAALPIGGQPGQLVGGTLTNRFKGTLAANNVHAKTGTMASVNALSGFVKDAGGRRLVFSALSNNATVSVATLLDQVVVTLANSGGASSSVSAQTVTPKVARVVNPEGEDVECSWVQAC